MLLDGNAPAKHMSFIHTAVTIAHLMRMATHCDNIIKNYVTLPRKGSPSQLTSPSLMHSPAEAIMRDPNLPILQAKRTIVQPGPSQPPRSPR